MRRQRLDHAITFSAMDVVQTRGLERERHTEKEREAQREAQREGRSPLSIASPIGSDSSGSGSGDRDRDRDRATQRDRHSDGDKDAQRDRDGDFSRGSPKVDSDGLMEL